MTGTVRSPHAYPPTIQPPKSDPIAPSARGVNAQISAAGLAFPPGLLADYAGTSVPNGWLACDGSAVSRTTYAALFAAIGTTWGAGDGTTTFNVPDLRNRFTRGPTPGAVADTGGADTVTLTAAQMPSQTVTITDPGHAHTLASAAAAGTVAVSSAADGTDALGGITNTATTGITGSVGHASPSAVDIDPPYAVVLKIIKT